MTLVLFVLTLVVAGVGANFLMRYMFNIADNRIKTSLSLFLSLLVVWTLAVFLLSPQHDMDTNLLLVRISFIGATSAVVSMVIFSYAVTHTRISRRRAFFLFVIYAVITLLEVSPYVISKVTLGENAVIPTREPLYFAVSVAIVSVGAYAIARLFNSAHKTLNKLIKRQRHFIATGLALGLLLAITTNILLPNLVGNTVPARFSAVAVLVFIATILYASLKHKFIDLKLAAVRTVAYIFSFSVMAAIYFGLAYLLSLLLFEDAPATGVSLSYANIIIALVLALIFQPLRQFFDRVTDKIFYRDRYDVDDFIARLGDILTSTTNLTQLLRRTSREIEQTIKASFVSFVVFRNDGNDVMLGLGGDITMHKADLEEIIRISEFGDETVLAVNQQLDEGAAGRGGSHKMIKLLRRQHVDLVLRLDDVGLVLIGNRKSSSYSQRDVRTLETIRDELIIAIQNARSVQDVRGLNKTLQLRVDQATKELRRSNDKLRKLDETKNEFLSMASHQLRTPLTSVKGYISMVLDGDVGEVNDQQKKLLTEAFVSSERMVRLIGDFLNVSRLQTGKFVIDRKDVDLAALVRDEVDSIESLARTREITLRYIAPKNLPTLKVDEDKIRQVVMNFIDNAIYYSRSLSTIVVKLYLRDGHVVYEVHDHGIGVPKAALDQLFTKFFRADNARRQRPDGTGVGLYLAKRVIDEHGGELIVESTEGKGSVFGFRLPIK